MDGVSACFTGLRLRTRDWLDQILENRRGPDPDYVEDADNLRDLIKRTARQTTIEIQGGYHEDGGGNGVNRWLTVVLSALTIAFIVGGVTLTVVVSALKQEVSDLKVQVDHVEKIVEPRYRGAG